jgi:hypothetical protein
MNTKAAVILIIGLLGSPVAYNFSQPQPVAHDWVFYGSVIKNSNRSWASMGIVLNRRTGERVKVFEVLVPKQPAYTHTEELDPALTAPPLDPALTAPPLELPE